VGEVWSGAGASRLPIRAEGPLFFLVTLRGQPLSSPAMLPIRRASFFFGNGCRQRKEIQISKGKRTCDASLVSRSFAEEMSPLRAFMLLSRLSFWLRRVEVVSFNVESSFENTKGGISKEGRELSGRLMTSVPVNHFAATRI